MHLRLTLFRNLHKHITDLETEALPAQEFTSLTEVMHRHRRQSDILVVVRFASTSDFDEVERVNICVVVHQVVPIRALNLHTPVLLTLMLNYLGHLVPAKVLPIIIRLLAGILVLDEYLVLLQQG